MLKSDQQFSSMDTTKERENLELSLFLKACCPSKHPNMIKFRTLCRLLPHNEVIELHDVLYIERKEALLCRVPHPPPTDAHITLLYNTLFFMTL